GLNQEQEPEIRKEVSYIVSVFSAIEMKKVKTKREAKNASIDLFLDEPWDTLKVQILAKISASLAPHQLNYKHYTVTYHINRILPKPGLTITTQADFDGMVKRVKGLATKTPVVNLTVVQDITDPQQEKRKKTRKEAEAILPGNEKKLKNIQLLCARWTCPKTDSACASTHCYIFPGTEEHLPLNHEQIDCWTAAMCKDGKESTLSEAATLQKPPNHCLFDVSNAKGAVLSPVLQHRLESAQAKSSSLSAPIFNFLIGGELVNLFQPQTLTAANGQGPVAHPSSVEASLLPSTHLPGQDMTVTDFCNMYKLDDDIATKLSSHSFKDAQLLCFISFSDLKDMDFKIGKVAALHDAVEKWSILNA
ncbi:hypothetical protein PAXRUDRAFT_175847, partial [Paxillus rubicundulus Ve08.2h10]